LLHLFDRKCGACGGTGRVVEQYQVRPKP
jgi:hypothetical protein